MRRIATAALLIALTMITAPFPARAADYPDRPIRMVVPYPPGGVLDTSARIIGRKLGSLLGQQIVIENKPGASGTLGAATVVKADADGYTLLLTTGDLVTMPSLLPAATFDSNKDLLPIAMVGSAPMALVANVNAPFNNAKELVAAAKAAPGTISYGIPGIGTINHVAAEWFFHAAGIKLQPVPYRGSAQLVNSVAAGDIPLGIIAPSTAKSLVEAHKLKVIGLSGKRRPSFLPATWATFAESGFDVDALLWIGVFAPVGTPEPIMKRIGEELARATADPEVKKLLNTAGIDVENMAQPEFGKYIRMDTARYDDIIRKTGIQIKR
jgi:tripartite-type tricarboxylate transporter receptor subunit TctC